MGPHRPDVMAAFKVCGSRVVELLSAALPFPSHSVLALNHHFIPRTGMFRDNLVCPFHSDSVRMTWYRLPFEHSIQVVSFSNSVTGGQGSSASTRAPLVC